MEKDNFRKKEKVEIIGYYSELVIKPHQATGEYISGMIAKADSNLSLISKKECVCQH